MLRTEEQREQICKNCPLAKTADIIGCSYSIIIINHLLSGQKKYSELEKCLVGASSRTLTLKLNYLVDEKLILKNELGYKLTKKGQGLEKVLKSMGKYGDQFL